MCNACEIIVLGLIPRAREKVVLDGKEHSEFRWCDFHEALRLLKWVGDKEALKKLNEIVTK